MGKGIKEIEGIAEGYAAKLLTAGIKTTEQLLERGARPAGRKQLAEATGISGKLLLRWINMADLFRISGVGEEYSDLLEASGVDTVVELSRRNPTNLRAKMVEVNADKKLVRQLPGEAQVEKWVAEAKTLPRAVFYDDSES